jgi:hypothetical protein
VLACAAALGQTPGAREHERGTSAGLARRLLENVRAEWRSPAPRARAADRTVRSEPLGSDPTYATGGDVTQCPEETVCPEQPTICMQTECPASPTQCPVRETECPQDLTTCPRIPTQCPADPTMCGPCRATEPSDTSLSESRSDDRAGAGSASLPFTTVPLHP